MVLAFVVGMLLVFAPFGSAPVFVAGRESVLRLPLLSHWRNLPTIFSQDFMIFTDGLYRPVSYAIIAVLRPLLAADCARLWHALLVAVHGLNTLLVFLLVRRFARHTAACILAAIAFCFHPLASIFVSEPGNGHMLLGVLFYLLTLQLYLAEGARPLRLLAAPAVFAVGLLTSPVVATLPVVVLLYEWLHGGRPARSVAGRVAPCVVLTGAAFALWHVLKPHPLLYSYAASTGGEWPSFYSIVGASRFYALGLLWGYRVPVVLHDLVPKLYTWRSVTFLLSAVALLGLFVLAVRRLRRGDGLLGLGLLLAVLGVAPFATTAWNPVEAYVSWTYLYLPLAGLALIVGAIADRIPDSRQRRRQAIVFVALAAVLGLNGATLYRINRLASSPTAYWRYVLSLAPHSPTAQLALGTAYLAEGNTRAALEYLFTPDTTRLGKRCRLMSAHYLERGEVWPASIHAIFSNDDRAQSAVFDATEIPDHAEAFLGESLARNPYDTQAMVHLAAILTAKGYLPGARRWLERALEIDPSCAEARALLHRLEDRGAAPGKVTPPDPEWARFLIAREPSERLCVEMARRSEAFRDDPVLAMHAGACMAAGGDMKGGLRKFAHVHERLPSCTAPAGWYSWHLTASGDPLKGESVARTALAATPMNGTLHRTLAYALLAQRRLEQAVGECLTALEIEPNAPEPYLLIGQAFALREDYKEAAQAFERAVELKPEQWRAHVGLGRALAELGRTEEAGEHFREAVRIAPEQAEPYREWAKACFRSGAYTEAWQHVEACRERGGKPDGKFLAALKAKLGKPKD